MKHRCENGHHIYEGIEKCWKRMFQILWKELHLKWKQEKISEIIYEKKKTAGLSQKELAQQLFVSESAVSKWNGSVLSDMTLVTSLCEILHVSEHELLTPVMICISVRLRSSPVDICGY